MEEAVSGCSSEVFAKLLVKLVRPVHGTPWRVADAVSQNISYTTHTKTENSKHTVGTIICPAILRMFILELQGKTHWRVASSIRILGV